MNPAFTAAFVNYVATKREATMTKPANLQCYINRIRNPIKRQYAKDYWKHLNGLGPKPEDPNNLSYMAAQAVRFELSRYYE